jgi:hypothetical protein
MRTVVRSGWAGTLLVVAGWRGASELAARRRVLVEAGELAPRIAARRARRIDRALGSAGLRPATHAAVHVGATRVDDLDDLGLLDAAMRRAARERMGVDAAGISRRADDRVDWVELLADSPREVDLPAPRAAARTAAPWWAVAGAVGAVALTIGPLVRPLGAASPWLALAGLALGLATWAAAGRR